MIKGDELETYQRLVKALGSYEYRNKLINRKAVDEDYVHFILSWLFPIIHSTNTFRINFHIQLILLRM